MQQTVARPFASILVPYDGSEPADAALALGLAIAAGVRGATLRVLTVVDEAPVIAQSATTMMAFDPTPIFAALDDAARARLTVAAATCTAAGVHATTELVHETPVGAILAACATHGCDLIVMGTHARSGFARAFLGSTTEGVLRTSTVPVLTTRAAEATTRAPFATLLVAIDDADASDAALALAAAIAQANGARIVVAHAADTTRLFDNAATYGFDPTTLEADVQRESAAVVAHALARAGLPTSGVGVALVDGHPAAAILDAAREHHATTIVMGSHGRRGIRRFFLGSIAEHVVRESPLPVLVVRDRWEAR